jgi:hypothetical protein
MRRKVEDEREARRCLKAAKAAGVTPGAWAREHGIDGRSLNAWRLNLAQGRETRDVPRLVELVAAPSTRGGARDLVRVGELVVEVGADFDDATLVRLVRALRSC